MSSFNSQGGKGLPGFLRRTLRLDDEGGVPNGNGDATIEEVTLKRTSSSGKVPSPIPPPRPVQSPPFHAAPQVPKLTIPSPIQEEKITKEEAPKEDVKSEETAPTKPEARKYVVQSPKPVPKPQKVERNVSYKQRQFESTIQADVVSMSELRKLSWNGAPVSPIWLLLRGNLIFPTHLDVSLSSLSLSLVAHTQGASLEDHAWVCARQFVASSHND